MAIELNTVKAISALPKQGASGAANAPAAKAPVAEANKATVRSPADNRQQVEAAVSKLSDFAQSVNRSLNFSVDEDLGKTVITVTDRETKEVVRQIPSEEFLDLAEDLQSLQGALLRTSA